MLPWIPVSPAAARRILRRYELEIIAHSAVALALMFVLGPVIGLLWQVFGSGWAFANAHLATMPHASSSENTIREAGLEP